jgi:uncharacterized protein (TIRG00374 family)
MVLALGLGLFGWFIHRAGPAEILANLTRLGGWAPLVLLPYFLVYAWDTLGWHRAFGRYAPAQPAYWTLFRVRWAAESINGIIPSAYLGGEALKVYLLRRRGYSGITAGTSVVIAKTGQILAQVLFIGVGAAAALTQLPAREGAWSAMLLITAAAFGLVGLLFLLQRRGMFSTLNSLLGRLPVRLPAMANRQVAWRKLDDQVQAFYRGDRLRFLQVTSSFLVGWLCDSLEVYLVCRLLGLPLAWPVAVAIESLISVAKAVGILVPAAMGVQEAGVLLLFALFGLPAPIAVTYAIIRRGRELAYVVVGGLLLYSEHAPWGSLSAPPVTESANG